MNAQASPSPGEVTIEPRDLHLRNLGKSYGTVEAVRGLNLTVRPGEMVSLIGPSGCGKTTTLRMIAGLEKPTSGSIVAGGKTISEGASVVPPERRDMGMVFQTYALWPHMSVSRNIGYGLKRKGLSHRGVARRVDEVLALVNMASFGDRFPNQLSGGQQQRVALARAIASQPRILLFDEPLSNLDAVLREQMRFEIRTLQQRLGITSIYVTHSQEEALALSDQIVVMNAGSIVQQGPPHEVYDTPRTEFVSGFIGLANILHLGALQVSKEGIRGSPLGNAVILAKAGATSLSGQDQIKVSIRPSEINILGGGNASRVGWNTLEGTVDSTVFTGSVVDYFVRLSSNPELLLRVQSAPPRRADIGDQVAREFDPARTVVLEE